MAKQKDKIGSAQWHVFGCLRSCHADVGRFAGGLSGIRSSITTIYVYVSQNPVVKSGLSFLGIAWAFSHAHARNWHPLTNDLAHAGLPDV